MALAGGALAGGVLAGGVLRGERCGACEQTWDFRSVRMAGWGRTVYSA
jgi:hypothetical protein